MIGNMKVGLCASPHDVYEWDTINKSHGKHRVEGVHAVGHGRVGLVGHVFEDHRRQDAGVIVLADEHLHRERLHGSALLTENLGGTVFDAVGAVGEGFDDQRF